MRQKEALELLEQALKQAAYPLGDLAVHAFGEASVEIEARLAVSSVDGQVLDRLVWQLAGQPAIQQAFWSPNTSE